MGNDTSLPRPLGGHGVPIHLAGENHQHHHHKEKSQGSNQQGVVLSLKGSEQENVADELDGG